MQPPEIMTPEGDPITSWEQWTRPKRDYQWKPGRSAMELAKSWFPDDAPSVPPEIKSILLSHPRLEGIRLTRAIPELVTPLPERGEGRNHDLWILGKTPLEQITICVEAKAEEPFGNYTVAEYRDLAMHRRQQGISTTAPERIEALLQMVGGDASVWDSVSYQLLAAICGTVIQARGDGSQLAVFLVHEFQKDLTTADQLQRNAENFELFLRTVGIESDGISMLSGPVKMGGVESLIGKIVRIY